MPVPDPDAARGDHRAEADRPHPERGRAGGERAGRRQHHRRPEGPDTNSEELVYLSGRVPRALRDDLHIRAIHEGRPLVDLLRDAISTYLDHNDGTRSHR